MRCRESTGCKNGGYRRDCAGRPFEELSSIEIVERCDSAVEDRSSFPGMLVTGARSLHDRIVILARSSKPGGYAIRSGSENVSSKRQGIGYRLDDEPSNRTHGPDVSSDRVRSTERDARGGIDRPAWTKVPVRIATLATKNSEPIEEEGSAKSR